MSIINSIRSYILDEEFRIIILKNKVNIVNYTSISLIDDNKVVVKHNSLNIFVNVIEIYNINYKRFIIFYFIYFLMNKYFNEQ